MVEKVNLKKWSMHGQSKRLMYNFLTVENHVYLMSYQSCTTWFMREIMNTEKE